MKLLTKGGWQQGLHIGPPRKIGEKSSIWANFQAGGKIVKHDIINELDFSHLVHSSLYDFTPAKQKFVQAKAEVSNQISIQNAYDPTPVPTATLEEYITSLNSDLTSAREERDNKLSMEEVRDMKLKSRMMQVDGGSASLNITLEATDNLGITSPTWSPIPENKVVIHPNFQNGKIRIDVDGDDNTNSGTKFYRFKMDD